MAGPARAEVGLADTQSGSPAWKRGSLGITVNFCTKNAFLPRKTWDFWNTPTAFLSNWKKHMGELRSNSKKNGFEVDFGRREIRPVGPPMGVSKPNWPPGDPERPPGGPRRPPGEFEQIRFF